MLDSSEHLHERDINPNRSERFGAFVARRANRWLFNPLLHDSSKQRQASVFFTAKLVSNCLCVCLLLYPLSKTFQDSILLSGDKAGAKHALNELFARAERGLVAGILGGCASADGRVAGGRGRLGGPAVTLLSLTPVPQCCD